MTTDPALISGRLNVNDFVAARTDDIKALEKLISTSGTGGKKRAFQSVPRTERRRAASHDSKRVPKKRGLRKLAEYENIRDNSKKPKVHKRVPKISPKPPILDIFNSHDPVEFPKDLQKLRYSNRQNDKIWLPTHVWHKKRAHMKQVGKFMIPITASQKQYRRTHRVAFHLDENSGMAFDTSYLSTIALFGNHTQLTEVIDKFCPNSSKNVYRNGFRVWNGLFQNALPISLMWFDSNAVGVQCHFDHFDKIYSEFSSLSRDVEVHDLRFAVGSIDLLGSKALQVLTECVIPLTQIKHNYSHDHGNHEDFNQEAKPHSEDLKKEWNRLGSCTNLDILPEGCLFNLTLSDPREAKFKYGGHLQHMNAERLVNLINLAKNENGLSVFNSSHRLQTLNTQLKQSEIDLKSENITAIPASVYKLNDGRIRLLVPRGWVLPFWLTIFKRRRLLLGGLRELHELSFESGKPFYPVDYPHTDGGKAYHMDLAKRNQEVYERKPNSKRVSYKRDLGNPFLHFDYSLIDVSNTSHVVLNAVRRGVPEPGARVFSVDDDTLKLFESGRQIEHSNIPNLHSNLAGFVTSGNFHLNSAAGCGVGMINSKNLRHCLVKNLGNDFLFLCEVQYVK